MYSERLFACSPAGNLETYSYMVGMTLPSGSLRSTLPSPDRGLQLDLSTKMLRAGALPREQEREREREHER